MGLPSGDMISVPPSAAKLISTPSDVKEIVVYYFSTTHQWMTFISKKRFFEQHLNPLIMPRIDVSLLILAMKLVNRHPSDGNGPRDPIQAELYIVIKRLHLEVELSGILTLEALQAGILISVYEVGNAIYPSAYLSIGTCARYGHALGINNTTVVETKSLAWLEQEERRRTWWAIVILDRYVPHSVFWLQTLVHMPRQPGF
jgi:hypothetical protein